MKYDPNLCYLVFERYDRDMESGVAEITREEFKLLKLYEEKMANSIIPREVEVIVRSAMDREFTDLRPSEWDKFFGDNVITLNIV